VWRGYLAESKAEQMSLFVDYQPPDPVHEVPSECLFLLEEHTDEVWLAEFSPDGTVLATGSKDRRIIVWDLECMLESSSPDDVQAGGPSHSDHAHDGRRGRLQVSVRFILRGHGAGISSLAWAPPVHQGSGIRKSTFPPKRLLSCGMDSCVILWDVMSGRYIQEYRCTSRFP